METMKAVRVHEYGGPEVLKYENAPRPRPVAGEVLVRIHAAGVNPVDWKVRAGQLKHVIAYPMPMIPGWDVSGVVEATGPNVTRLKKGDEVYGQPDVVRNGTYAEFTVVPESELALKPTSIDHVHAASVPIAAIARRASSPRSARRARPFRASSAWRRSRRSRPRQASSVPSGSTATPSSRRRSRTRYWNAVHAPRGTSRSR